MYKIEILCDFIQKCLSYPAFDVIIKLFVIITSAEYIFRIFERFFQCKSVINSSKMSEWNPTNNILMFDRSQRKGLESMMT